MKAELYDSDEAEEEIEILPPGTVVSERYRIESVLGRGGMGVVYKAEQIHMNKLVAMKMMLQQATASQADHRRFQREAQAASLLSHPNIVSIHDFGFYNGQAYLCMDYLQGANLEVFLKEKPLTLDQFRHIFAQACDALQHAHDKGIVHRDLKPGNLCISEKNGDPLHLYVLDFGLVKMMEAGNDGKLTRTNMVVGSPVYMSPEQCRALNLDQRSDIYSLACVMYESLCGLPPFRADTVFDMMNAHISQPAVSIREFAPGIYVPAGLDKAILQALSKNPDDRPQSMQELARAIEASFSGAPDLVMPTGVRSKISNTENQSITTAGADLKASNEMSGRKKKQNSKQTILLSLAIWIGVIGALGVGVIFGLSLHKGGENGSTKVANREQNESSPDSTPAASNTFANVPNRNGAVVSGNNIQVGPASLPAVPGAPPQGKMPAGPLPPGSPLNAAKAAANGIAQGQLPLPVPPSGSSQNPITFSSSGSNSLLPLPPSTVASIIRKGTDGPSSDQLKLQGFAAYSQNNFQEAYTKLSGLSDAETNSAVLGRLIISAYKSGDNNRAQAYLSRFKSLNSFSVRSEVRDDVHLLKQVLEYSGRPSTNDDYEFADNMLDAIRNAASRSSDTYGMWKQAVLESNVLLRARQRGVEADRILDEAMPHANTDDAVYFKSLLSPEAGGTGVVAGRGPTGSGPMGPGPMGGSPMGGPGGRIGAGPMGGPPIGPGPGLPGMGPPGGPGGLGGPMGGRFAGPPGQDGGG